MIGRFWDRHGHEKSVVERVTASEMLLAAGFAVTEFGSRQDDPPDCEGWLDGQWSAVELTQLINEEARAQSEKSIKQQKPEVYFLWEREDVLREIQKLIDVKDSKQYKGGPYQRFVLIINTDEPELSEAAMGQFLEGATFRTRVFDDVFVGLSYLPQTSSYGEGRYPTFRLSLDPQGSPSDG
jgi:hypothetical protein